MTTLPWILFAIAVVWHVFGMRLNHRKRIHLESYAIYLLIADGIRQQHKTSFETWIAQTLSPNALALSSAAHKVIDNMAEQLAAGDPTTGIGSSVLGAHAMLWQFKKGAASNST